MIKQAADQLQTSLRDYSSDFAATMAHVEQLHQKGELTEQRLCRFAESGKFDETTAALSLLTDLPVGAIERPWFTTPAISCWSLQSRWTCPGRRRVPFSRFAAGLAGIFPIF